MHPLPLKQLRDLALHLRTHVIFGCNTDVGKTICSTGLVRASRGSHYIKPLQCGGSDQNFIERHADFPKDDPKLRTLFRWNTPASPHIASILEEKPKSDEEVLSAVQAALLDSRTATSTVWLETAGGVLSPSSASPKNVMPCHALTNSWGWTVQADLYQPLIEISSVVLVGDGKLGGISATLSSLESLLLRGYHVDCIILIEKEGYDNISALREYAKRKFKLRSGVGSALFEDGITSIVSLPELPPEPEPLEQWYDSLLVSDTFDSLNKYLLDTWEKRIDRRNSLDTQSNRVNWWPGNEVETSCSQSSDRNGQFVDPSLSLTFATAIGWNGNVRLPETIIESDAGLSKALVQGISDGWASRIIFNKSTDSNVSLAMGILAYQKWHNFKDKEGYSWTVAAQGHSQKKIHHSKSSVEQRSKKGDRNSLCERIRTPFATPWLSFKKGKLCITTPSTGESIPGFTLAAILDVESRVESEIYRSYLKLIQKEWEHFEGNHSSFSKPFKIGSIMIQPMLTGGIQFKFVDPLWQRALIDVAKNKRVPVIFDESASFLYPQALRSSTHFLQVNPDIATFDLKGVCGTFPVTLTNEDVYEALQIDDEGKSLMISNTDNTKSVKCVNAIHIIQGFTNTVERYASMLKIFDVEKVESLSHQPMVQECFALGNMLTLQLQSRKPEEVSRCRSIAACLAEHGFIVKISENTLCAMVSPLKATRQECDRLCNVLNDAMGLFS